MLFKVASGSPMDRRPGDPPNAPVRWLGVTAIKAAGITVTGYELRNFAARSWRQTFATRAAQAADGAPRKAVFAKG